MKIASYDGHQIGVIVGEEIVDVTSLGRAAADSWPPVGMLAFIADFASNRAALATLIERGKRRPLHAVRLETPVAWPNKVIAFPANYHEHIAEMKNGLVSAYKASGQGFFLKANSSLSGPADPIVLPNIDGREVHHECEMAIVIARAGRDIPVGNALSHIFGYACLVDVVVRGKEERVMRKSFDSFCPVGPWITTADEISNPNNIDLQLRVNGELRQKANTRDLIVGIPEMIAMASSVMTLQPGDIIATGTPAGVAPLLDGDALVITIEGVGEMALKIKRGTLGKHSVWDK